MPAPIVTSRPYKVAWSNDNDRAKAGCVGPVSRLGAPLPHGFQHGLSRAGDGPPLGLTLRPTLATSARRPDWQLG